MELEVNMHDLVSKGEFVALKKRNRGLIKVVGSCYNTETGWYDRSLIKAGKAKEIKLYDYGIVRNVLFSANVGRGTVLGYIPTDDPFEYIVVKEKPMKEIVAVRMVDFFYQCHVKGVPEEITFTEMKALIRQTLDELHYPERDINLRTHYNYSRYENLPLEYKYVQYVPYTIMAKHLITAVPLKSVYKNLDYAFSHTPIEYWCSEADSLRKWVKEIRLMRDEATEEEKYGYLWDSGIMNRIFKKGDVQFGRCGKSGEHGNVEISFYDVGGNLYQHEYQVDFEVDKVLELDKCRHSISTELKKKKSSWLYVPQIRNSVIGLDLIEPYMNHKINLLIMFDKETVYFFFLKIANATRFRDNSVTVIASKAFTLTKEKATAFNYYSKNDKRKYRITGDTVFDDILEKERKRKECLKANCKKTVA